MADGRGGNLKIFGAIVKPGATSTSNRIPAEGPRSRDFIDSDQEETQAKLLTKIYFGVEAATIVHFCHANLRDISGKGNVTKQPMSDEPADKLEIKYAKSKADKMKKMFRDLDNKLEDFVTENVDFEMGQGMKIEDLIKEHKHRDDILFYKDFSTRKVYLVGLEYDTVQTGLHQLKVCLGKIKPTRRKQRQRVDSEENNGSKSPICANSTSNQLNPDLLKFEQNDSDVHVHTGRNSRNRLQCFLTETKIATAASEMPEHVWGSDSFRHLKLSGSHSLKGPRVYVSDSNREPKSSGSESFRVPIISGSDYFRVPINSSSDSFRDPKISGSDSFREPNISSSDSFRELNISGSDSFRESKIAGSDPLRGSIMYKSGAQYGFEIVLHNGFKLKVYQALITQLNVDAIVNSANSKLEHTDGVARILSMTAGHELDQESRDYTRKFGYLKVGDKCLTTAGNMTQYKSVIHAVGPQWCDYSDKVECMDDLYKTVWNVLDTCDTEGYFSVGICPIGADSYGVPKELYTDMYMKAAVDFSALIKHHFLKELHIIDVDTSILKHVQQSVEKWLHNTSSLDPKVAVPKFLEIHPQFKICVEQKEITSTTVHRKLPKSVYRSSNASKHEHPEHPLSYDNTNAPANSNGIKINSASTSYQQSSGYDDGEDFSFEADLNNGFKLKVYKASITRLEVYTIVNAANDWLMHGGGVAREIAVAAGHKLDQESRDYISRFGYLRVGENCLTTAGNMKQYKSVIHAVGPQWHDYSDKVECMDALYETVWNVLDTCDTKSYISVGMSSISAGIYGVPKELCADMYVKAAVDFSDKNTPFPKELHIIDVDTSLLKLVQQSAEKWQENVPIDQRVIVPQFLVKHPELDVGGWSTPNQGGRNNNIGQGHSRSQDRSKGNKHRNPGNNMHGVHHNRDQCHGSQDKRHKGRSDSDQHNRSEQTSRTVKRQLPKYVDGSSNASKHEDPEHPLPYDNKTTASANIHGIRSHNAPRSYQHSRGYDDGEDFSFEADLNHGFKLKVYKASITRLEVDTIVNSANDCLMHGGGVARVIAVAAGQKLDQESKEYIKRFGYLKVGENCLTTAGNMTQYKSVIHAVGPQWHDYRDKVKCIDALYETVWNVLETCDIKAYCSVGMSSISAGIYGVPEELCADMYVKAAVDFSEKKTQFPKELHIIDVDTSILKLVQQSAEKWQENMPIDQRVTVPQFLAKHPELDVSGWSTLNQGGKNNNIGQGHSRTQDRSKGNKHGNPGNNMHGVHHNRDQCHGSQDKRHKGRSDSDQHNRSEQTSRTVQRQLPKYVDGSSNESKHEDPEHHLPYDNNTSAPANSHGIRINSAPRSYQHSSGYDDGGEFSFQADLHNGFRLKIYKASITRLEVDTIVNAANDCLMHGEGVARVIAVAAGHKLDKDSRDYISRFGYLKVGENCLTTAGNMKQYKSVLHAVGPQWHDYRDKVECMDDLYKTVWNVLDTCDTKSYFSVGMSPISAGHYGVPKELCADMYVKAAVDFSNKNTPFPKELHIIDVDTSILKLVQQSVEKWQENMSIDQKVTVPKFLAKHPELDVGDWSTSYQGGRKDFKGQGHSRSRDQNYGRRGRGKKTGFN